MTPHISGTSLSAEARYAAGTREILECWFESLPIRNEYLIVDGGMRPFRHQLVIGRINSISSRRAPPASKLNNLGEYWLARRPSSTIAAEPQWRPNSESSVFIAAPPLAATASTCSWSSLNRSTSSSGGDWLNIPQGGDGVFILLTAPDTVLYWRHAFAVRHNIQLDTAFSGGVCSAAFTTV